MLTGNKGKVSISLDAILLQDIQKYSKANHISRSQVIESVLKEWQKELKKKQLIEGYKAAAKENAQIAEEFSVLDYEGWPNE